jgi:hypothetical protein
MSRTMVKVSAVVHQSKEKEKKELDTNPKKEERN